MTNWCQKCKKRKFLYSFETFVKKYFNFSFLYFCFVSFILNFNWIETASPKEKKKKKKEKLWPCSVHWTIHLFSVTFFSISIQKRYMVCHSCINQLVLWDTCTSTRNVEIQSLVDGIRFSWMMYKVYYS